MSVIEECARAVAASNMDERYDLYIDDIKTILTTLAGKLDEKALAAAEEAYAKYYSNMTFGKIAQNTALYDAIQAYLNQLINEEKE